MGCCVSKPSTKEAPPNVKGANGNANVKRKGKRQLGAHLSYNPASNKKDLSRPKVKPSRSLAPAATGRLYPAKPTPTAGIVIDSTPWRYVADVKPVDNIVLDKATSSSKVQPAPDPQFPKDTLKDFGRVPSGALGLSRISPSDIYQGEEGDCWYLSALACIAEYPDLVKACFPRGDRLDSSGTFYDVRFIKDGRTTVLQVDPSLYCGSFPGDSSMPTYAQLFPPQEPKYQWVAILEKAYAKLHGGFAAISGGMPDVAFRDLTGSPAIALWLLEGGGGYAPGAKADTDAAWQLALSFFQSSCLIAAAHGGDEAHDRDGVDSVNLPDGHAFSVLYMVEVTEKDDGRNLSFKLMNLRNPWGTLEYSGPWSTGSIQWKQYPSVAKQIQRRFNIVLDTDRNDGDFWMTWEDFLQYGFFALFVSFAPCGLSPQSIPGVMQDYSQLSFQVTVGRADVSLAFFNFMQEDPRLNNNQSPAPVPVSLALRDYSGKEVTCTLAYTDQTNMFVLISPDVSLIAGASYTLVVTPQPGRNSKLPARYVVSVHSDKQLTVSSKPSRIEYPKIQRR